MRPAMTDGELVRIRVILNRYPAVLADPVQSTAEIVPVRPGFSGARVWRIVLGASRFCLRRWPDGRPEVRRLHELHRWLTFLSRTGSCPVAAPVSAVDGATTVCDLGILWQLEPWLAGAPDESEPPSTSRLSAAMHALASLHLVSHRYQPSPDGEEWFSTRVGPSPAVVERMQLARRWTPQLLADCETVLRARVPTRLSELALLVIQHAGKPLSAMHHELHVASDLAVPLFPCLRDVWRDHILYEEDRVTGIVDPAAARTETAGADLSRFLGSVLGEEQDQWQLAVEAYAAVRPLSDSERRLIPILDRSNLLLSGLQWVRRIVEEPPLDPDGRIVARLGRIVRRLSSLSG